MLDLKLMQKNPELVREALRRRHSPIDMDEFIALDARRRQLLTEVEALKNERNTSSAEVAKKKRAGEDASEIIERVQQVNERIKSLDLETAEVDEAVRQFMLSVPNTPHESVPEGGGEDDNVEISRWGEPPVFDFEPMAHWDMGPALGGLDFERAAKLTGSRFCVSWGWAAKLERALIAFMLDIQTGENGYTEVMPPVIVNRDSMTGTGQLPKFEEDLFRLEGWDYFLIPTAEVPVTNLHRDEVLEEADLPKAYAAHTLCFRAEAGSHGKDTRGVIRQHQFNKVELVRLTRPESSYEELELLRGHAESILQRLELPYRVITLCAGDLGFSSAKTYDLEVWLPGQNTYREISSCSNFEDFQARRANLRYKPAGAKKSQFVHTLNGSGLAVGRTLVAVMENCQTADGGFEIPKALRPYMGGLERVSPK